VPAATAAVVISTVVPKSTHVAGVNIWRVHAPEDPDRRYSTAAVRKAQPTDPADVIGAILATCDAYTQRGTFLKTPILVKVALG
jgi:hypothetical protein